MMRFGHAAFLLLAASALACNQGPSHPAAPDAGTSPSFSIAARGLPDGRQGMSYAATIDTIGDPPLDLRWSIAAGSLPEGVVLNAAGPRAASLSGAPTQAGAFAFTVAAEGASGGHSTGGFSLQIRPPLSIVGDLIEGAEGQPFSADILVAGAPVGAVQWTISSGSLPVGIQLIGRGGGATLQGTPDPGNFNFTVLAVDAEGARAERAYALRIRSTLGIDGNPAPSGTETVAYQASLGVHGGVGSGYHWGFSGDLPPGIFFLEQTGASALLSGTPTMMGSYSFLVTVSDDLGGFAERPLTIDVGPRLEMVTAGFPNGRIAEDYSVSLSARGGGSTAYQWFVQVGRVPPGLSLTSNGANATVSGRPTEIGSFQFTIALALSPLETVTDDIRVEILENPPVISTAALPGGTWGVPYSAMLAAQSKVGGPFSWQLTRGALPPGVQLVAADAPTATLKGTPLQVGTFQFTIGFTDAGGTAAASYALDTSSLPELEVMARIFPPARVGRVYSATIGTRGARGGLSWQLAGGQLPPGLDLAPDGAGLSVRGTPTQDGFYRFAVRATDEGGATAQQDLSIHVGGARFWLAAAHTPEFFGPWTVTVRDVSTGTPGPATDLLSNFIAGDSALVFDLIFSPNPDLLSFWEISTKTLYLADLRSTPAVVKLTDQLRSDRGGPLRWAPDGTHFAYATEPVPNSFEFIHFLGEVGDSAVSAAPLPTAPCQYEGIWSPDSTRYATTSADRRSVYVSEGATTRAIALAPGQRADGPVAWTPDSRRLIFVAFDEEQLEERLFALDPGVEPARVFAVTPPGVDVNAFIRVAPDGGSIDLGVTSLTEVWALDVRSPQIGFARRVVDMAPASVSGFWSPDSRLLALFSQDPAAPVSVIDRDQIGLSAPLPLGGSSPLPPNFRFRWTPDSQRLLYADAAGDVFSVPLDGSAADLLLSGPLNPNELDPLSADSQLLIYASAAGLAAIDMASPPPRSPVVLDAKRPNTFAVAHVRKAVFYYSFGANGAGNKLWMVDLSGPTPGLPAELLDFGTGILDFAVSE